MDEKEAIKELRVIRDILGIILDDDDELNEDECFFTKEEKTNLKAAKSTIAKVIISARYRKKGGSQR